MLLCKYCNSERKNDNSLRNHERTCRENPDRYTPTGGNRKGLAPWNKGLDKNSHPSLKKTSEAISKFQRDQVSNGTYVPRRMGVEAREKTSERQSLHNNGGRCKWFDVNGIKVQGTWEYNVAIKLNELGIKWSKPRKKEDILTYIIGGTVKSYSPDFYLEEENVYLEIKGYWWGNDKEKMKLVREQHPDKKIVIMEKIEYNKFLDGELVW